MKAVDVGENQNPDQVYQALDNELGVRDWWTPLHRRPVTPPRPRVTEDGLKVPSWWSDDETESQSWLQSQGVIV